MESLSAVFSKDRFYRYTLWRHWPLLGLPGGYCMFIGLNPSTADETHDDPTVRRCISFAKRWGFGGLCMTNIFACRATDPQMMLSFINPVGQENDRYLLECYAAAGLVVAAWGNLGTHLNRGKQVREFLCGPMFCLGKTKLGQPRHPLYVSSTTNPVPF
jgi:hypothetical protein